MLGISTTPGKIPVLGMVTAGTPILAVEEEATEFFPIPDNLMQFDGDLFMLNVHGDSMVNIGILDGDKVIVRKQENADNGDVVVAMNDNNEATVKRFSVKLIIIAYNLKITAWRQLFCKKSLF
jgi:SOS-response transcriptional repressors (RecA-mediated autopeptidases)